MTFNLRGDKCAIFREFLLDEFHLSTVFKFFDPLAVRHVDSPRSRPKTDVSCRIGGSRGLQTPRRSQLQFQNSCGLGHTGAGHFLLDAGIRLVFESLLSFLTQDCSIMTAGRKHFSLISHSCGVFNAVPPTADPRNISPSSRPHVRYAFSLWVRLRHYH